MSKFHDMRVSKFVNDISERLEAIYYSLEGLMEDIDDAGKDIQRFRDFYYSSENSIERLNEQSD